VKAVSPDETLAVTAAGNVYDLNSLTLIKQLLTFDATYYFFDRNNTLYIMDDEILYMTESQLRGE
jgi:hypothetical protein